MARRSWHKSADTRAEILDEAERQLQAVGYAHMTIGSIAKGLGMSPANVFKNFGNKAGLIDAVALRWVMEIDAAIETTTGITPPSSRLRAMAHLILKTHLARGEMPARLAIMIGLDYMPPPSALAFFHRLLQRLEMLIDDGIAEGEFAPCDGPITAAAVCDCLITILDPAAVLRGRSLFTVEEMTKKCDHLIDFVIRGLGAPA
ncbi:MAG: ttgR 2 [Proteobacteria bacterium]|nr:ttgR 2 [Pseudomonadota bacterium]